MPANTVKTNVTIIKCGLCEHDNINPVTVHKIWDNDIGSSLFVVTCNKCFDFVPVKLPSFDIADQNMNKALELWNEYQIARSELTEAMKGPAKTEDGKEEK